MLGNRTFRTVNVMDDCSNEAIAIEVDTPFWSREGIRTIDRRPKKLQASCCLFGRTWLDFAIWITAVFNKLMEMISYTSCRQEPFIRV
jgi:hypothetical protein